MKVKGLLHRYSVYDYQFVFDKQTTNPDGWPLESLQGCRSAGRLTSGAAWRATGSPSSSLFLPLPEVNMRAVRTRARLERFALVSFLRHFRYTKKQIKPEAERSKHGLNIKKKSLPLEGFGALFFPPLTWSSSLALSACCHPIVFFCARTGVV